MTENPQSQQPISIQSTTPTQTKFPIITFVLCLIIVALISGGGVYIMQQNKINQLQTLPNNRQVGYIQTNPTNIPTVPEQTTVIPTALPTKNLNSSLVALDNTWNLYTNNKSGFSIKLPKAVEGGIHNNCPSISNVPVVAFDDTNGSYITVKTFYEYPKDTEGKVCQKTENSLSIIDQRANQWKSGQGNNLFVPSSWHIVTAKAEKDSDVDSFIKANYGTGCKIGAKSLSPSGVYDVKIEGDGLDLEKSKCPVNFIYAVKYSPEFKKVATWGVGQDVVFSSQNYQITYDADMINSFKFVN